MCLFSYSDEQHCPFPFRVIRRAFFESFSIRIQDLEYANKEPPFQNQANNCLWSSTELLAAFKIEIFQFVHFLHHFKELLFIVLLELNFIVDSVARGHSVYFRVTVLISLEVIYDHICYKSQ